VGGYKCDFECSRREAPPHRGPRPAWVSLLSHDGMAPPSPSVQEYVHQMQPGGWLKTIAGHPCFTPGKVWMDQCIQTTCPCASGCHQGVDSLARPATSSGLSRVYSSSLSRVYVFSRKHDCTHYPCVSSIDPETWTQHISAQDLVIPSLKHAHHFKHSPLLAAPLPTLRPTASIPGATGAAVGAAQSLRRDILLFFRGDVGKHRLPIYRCGLAALSRSFVRGRLPTGGRS